MAIYEDEQGRKELSVLTARAEACRLKELGVSYGQQGAWCLLASGGCDHCVGPRETSGLPVTMMGVRHFRY